MHLIMFDIDGTLVESNNFDSECYVNAIEKVLKIKIDSNWSKYKHTTDAGILDEIITQNHLQEERELIHSNVKAKFIDLITNYINTNQILPIKGAERFISSLRTMDKVAITFATGGWNESAQMKLKSVGIDYNGIPIASSSDHFSRTEIMKISEYKSGFKEYASKTYFGDAIWDKQAAMELGYNFILVGNRIQHSKSISDFCSIDHVLSLIGL